MAFTENAAGFGSGSKGKIKTQDLKKSAIKETKPEDLMMNEDQAIAAFSIINLSDEEMKVKEEKSSNKKKSPKPYK
jgi:hypothetical protein